MRISIPLIVLATALTCSLGSAPAHARARVFVASYGSDSNPCTFLSPCKTFQQAVNVVDAGGEVTAIDSAGFGPISITKAVTITSPDGVEAGIVPVASGTAIEISAGSTDVINLRGLTMAGGHTASDGIRIDGAGTVNVQNCVIKDFNNRGIEAIPSGAVVINVSDTIFSGMALQGFFVLGSGTGSAVVSLNRDQFLGNVQAGADFDTESTTGTIKAMIANSYFTGNSVGVFAFSASGKGPLAITITNSQLFSNGTGIDAQGPQTIITLAQTTIAGDQSPGSGYFTSGGATIRSHGNNSISSTNNTGTLTPLGEQ
jgi:hypothetical protein